MKKYAICEELIELKSSVALEPWFRAKTQIFKKVSEVPDDHILISVHFPPWRSPFKEWIAKGNNYLEIEFGYWGINSPRRVSKRITYNGHHNLKMKPVPFSRLHTLNPAVQDWKTTRGDILLLIEPQPEIIQERTNMTFLQWREQFLEKINSVWKGPVRWRRKAGGKDPNRWPSFINDLQTAHAVVGDRTMACVEAVMLGYPAYTIDYSMVSLLMGNDLTHINNIILPDRTKWLEHVSWSQFYPEDFANKFSVIEMIEQYQM